MVVSQLKVLNNPFPGLRPFKTEESYLFFGREGQVDEILHKLDENKFVSVLGSSGSGKSSMIYCGLIPGLYGGFMTQAGSNWQVIKMRPGNSPILNLSEAIVNELDDSDYQDPELAAIRKESALAFLKGSSLGLVDLIRQYQTDEDGHFLLLVDQFEELFRFNRVKDTDYSFNESSAFIKLLLNAIQQSEVPIYVVMTMRSDYIGDCAQFPQLTRMINDSHYLIPQMTREQKKAAILGPVAVAHGKMSPKLTQQLLNDLGDKQDALPILQHALMRTWDFWLRQSDDTEELDSFHYEAIGGMDGALSQHANEAFSELDDRQRGICEILFKCLTEKGPDGRGIRRPTQVKEIAEIAQASPSEVIAVIDKFRQQGRTLLMPSYLVKLDESAIIDISHESLMRVWDRCKDWVEEESESVKTYLRLAEAAAMYQTGKTGLWRPPDLQLALNWEKKQKPNLTWAQRYDPAFERTMVFLETSRKAYEEEQKSKERHQKAIIRRNRIAALAGGFVAIAGLILVLYANLQKQEAEKEKERAVLSEQKAAQAAERAQNNAEQAEQQKLIAQRKEEEAKKSAQQATKAQQEALSYAQEAENQKNIALMNAAEAQRQTEIANEQTELALNKTRLAEESEYRAEKEATRADRLRFLSISQTMAVKSQQIKDTTQRALVAKQAHIFNERYMGNPFHPDIYNGLYYAEKLLEGDNFNKLSGHSDGVRAIASFSSGKWMLTAGSDGKILKWDLENTSSPPDTVVLNPQVIYRSLAISPDEKLLACGTDMATIELYDIPSGFQKVTTLKGHSGTVWNLQFNPSDKKLYSTGEDKKLLLWDINQGEPQFEEVATLDKLIKGMALNPKKQKLIAVLQDGSVLSWDIAHAHKQAILQGPEMDKSSALALSPDGNMLVKGFENGKINLWDISKNEVDNYLEGHDAIISQIVFSPNGKFVATSSLDGTVRLWRTGFFNDQPIVLKDHDSWVQTISFSQDGEYIITGCVNNLIRIYPVDMQKMADRICVKIKRNMNIREWRKHVGEDVDFELTCPQLPGPKNDGI